MSNSEAYNHFTYSPVRGESDKVPDYAEYYRCSQRSTLNAKWRDQRIFPEGLTSKPCNKEEIS